MIFASISFIFVFLPLYLLIDRLLAHYKVSARNFWLLLASLLFYTWGEAYNVLLLTGLGVLNYGGAFLLKQGRKRRNLSLVLLLMLNLGVLFCFKYFAWSVETALGILDYFFPYSFSRKLYISIPLGISFFTFHAISYLMDVYRGHIQPARSALNFLTYFCMFPHLVAGPIVRYAHVQDDLNTRNRKKSTGLFTFGVYRFLQGFNKKVLIANSAAMLADQAFSLSQQGHLSCADAWIGIVAYTVQIYYDFSGYSDMAIGLAAMLGFHFEENFRRPYSCTSMRDFWRRWHISLSSWLRDYLYIPLGGSREGLAKTYRNLLIIFLICGLWHGADFTFVAWGVWHGLFLVLERVWHNRLPSWHAPVAVGRVYAILVVMFGWVMFRAENLGDACSYTFSLFSFSSAKPLLSEFLLPLLILPVGVLICLLPDRWIPSPSSDTPTQFPFFMYFLQALLAVESVALLVQGGRNPFIYFNF